MNDWKGCLIQLIFYGSILVIAFANNGPLRTICIFIGVIGAIIGLIQHFGGGGNNRDYPDYGNGNGQS